MSHVANIRKPQELISGEEEEELVARCRRRFRLDSKRRRFESGQSKS